MAWPQDAYVGQEVVCTFLDTSITKNRSCLAYPIIKDEIYTILDITSQNGKLYFRVQDLNHYRIWWLSHQFRPVTLRSTETGMEILRKLQDPQNHKHRENA